MSYYFYFDSYKIFKVKKDVTFIFKGIKLKLHKARENKMWEMKIFLIYIYIYIRPFPFTFSNTKSILSYRQLTGPLIERVATEFNKLQFYVTRSKGHPLVDKVKPVSYELFLLKDIFFYLLCVYHKIEKKNNNVLLQFIK